MFLLEIVAHLRDPKSEKREQSPLPESNQNQYLPLPPIIVSYIEGVRQVRKDPICGMDVDEKTARHTSSYEGKTYYFCSEMCKRTFDKSPSRYAK